MQKHRLLGAEFDYHVGGLGWCRGRVAKISRGGLLEVHYKDLPSNAGRPQAAPRHLAAREVDASIQNSKPKGASYYVAPQRTFATGRRGSPGPKLEKPEIYKCGGCDRGFTTLSGRSNHYRYCEAGRPSRAEAAAARSRRRTTRLRRRPLPRRRRRPRTRRAPLVQQNGSNARPAATASSRTRRPRCSTGRRAPRGRRPRGRRNLRKRRRRLLPSRRRPRRRSPTPRPASCRWPRGRPTRPVLNRLSRFASRLGGLVIVRLDFITQRGAGASSKLPKKPPPNLSDRTTRRPAARASASTSWS